MQSNYLHKKICLLLVTLTTVTVSSAQQVDMDNLLNFKDKFFKFGGGVFLNTVYTQSSDAAMQRQPFTYVVGGNVNLQLMSYSLPFSFSYTNQKFQFSQPFRFNRLSVHPKYKWLTAHIGDVTMSFSPYSLNGHQFTGAGAEIAHPDLPIRFAVLYGRFLQATEADSFNLPAYRRMGWGAKADYEGKKIKGALALFQAQDKLNSLETAPDFRNVFPMQNVVLDGSLGFKLTKWLNIDAQYAVSSLTRDIRSNEAAASESNPFKYVMPTNSFTSVYTAVKAGINAQLDQTNIRIGYERVDPDYMTLGAYFFNNDLENYTLSLSRGFLKNKVNIALTGGWQHDDLKGTKARSSGRGVGSANVNVQFSEKISLNTTYSTFQSFSNMKSQFDFINQTNPYENIDTFNFVQVSQNANASVNWMLGKSEKKMQNLSVNLAWQDASDKQGGIVRKGNASTLMNANLNYTLAYPKSGLGMMAGVNGTYNTVGLDDMVMVGPMIGLNKVFTKIKLKTGVNAAYNNSFKESQSLGSVWNLRAQAAYTMKERHQYSLNVMQQYRTQPLKGKNNLLNISLNYAFSF